MKLAAIILLLVAMWTFSIGVDNVRRYEAKSEEPTAQGRAIGYAVGSFIIPTIALGGAWLCWRKSLVADDDSPSDNSSKNERL